MRHVPEDGQWLAGVPQYTRPCPDCNPDTATFPDDTEREVFRLRAEVRALEECVRLSNESALQSAGRIRELESLLSRTLDNCKFYADEFKDEVRAAIRARGK